MLYVIKGKNLEIGERTKEKIEKKLRRLSKLFPEETTATVTIGETKIYYVVEVTIPIHKRILRAEAQENDLMAAVDKAVDVMDLRVVKYKNRMRTRARQNASFKEEYESIRVEDKGAPEDPAFKIERNKKFELRLMDAEEAVMQMELLGHSFFVFRNGDTDEVNVVYKRRNGSYGLIEPEF